MLNDTMNPVDRHFNKQMKKKQKKVDHIKKKRKTNM